MKTKPITIESVQKPHRTTKIRQKLCVNLSCNIAQITCLISFVTNFSTQHSGKTSDAKTKDGAEKHSRKNKISYFAAGLINQVDIIISKLSARITSAQKRLKTSLTDKI